MKKRIFILGSSGIISKNLQKMLREKKKNFVVYGKKEINLINKRSIHILQKKVKKMI